MTRSCRPSLFIVISMIPAGEVSVFGANEKFDAEMLKVFTGGPVGGTYPDEPLLLEHPATERTPISANATSFRCCTDQFPVELPLWAAGSFSDCPFAAASRWASAE